MAVELDHYQTIVNVHWPSRILIEYITIRTDILANVILGSSVQGWGDFTGVGSAPTGTHVQSYYDVLTRRHAPSFETDRFRFSTAYDVDGGEVIVSGDGAITITGGVILPTAIVPGDGYTSGVAAYVGPNIHSEPAIRWVALTEALVVPIAGDWKVGSAVTEITASPYTGSVAEVNPYFPTAGTYAKTRQVSASIEVINTLDITPSSIVLTAYPELTFVPIGAILSGPSPHLLANIICRRVS